LAKGFRGKAKNCFRVANAQVEEALENQVTLLIFRSDPAIAPVLSVVFVSSMVRVVKFTMCTGTVCGPESFKARHACDVDPAHQRGYS